MKNDTFPELKFEELPDLLSRNFGKHLKDHIKNAVQELERVIQPAYVYNTDADLIDFHFTSYKPPFELRKLSLASLTLGEDIITSIEFYMKKGDDITGKLLNNGAMFIMNKIADHINFQICRDFDEELKQGKRKYPGAEFIPVIENKTITDYLNSEKIQISINPTDFTLVDFTSAFFIEWTSRHTKHPDLSDRCSGCNQEKCKFRIPHA